MPRHPSACASAGARGGREGGAGGDRHPRARTATLSGGEVKGGRGEPRHRLSRTRYLKRRRGTSHIASAAILQDILLVPCWRSRKTIGTSTTRKPARTAR